MKDGINSEKRQDENSDGEASRHVLEGELPQFH
jgi:hypothetical protein